MTRTNAFALSVMIAALTVLADAAPDDRKAGALLQAADAKATIEGDAKGAIALYKEAVAEAGTNQALVARALFGLGEAYRRVDPPAAQETFARIVRDFAEPKDVVAAARARVTPAPRKQQSAGTAPRLVLGADRAQIIDVSADGSTAVGMSTGQRNQLLVWNLASGESRTLSPIAGGGTTFDFPRIAPDGRTVAYRWNETAEGKAAASVRLVGTEPNATARALLNDDGIPAAWSHDGRSLLVLRGSRATPRSLEWLTIADGSTRRLKTFEAWQNPGGFAVSPDGSIAYAINPRTGSNDRHIHLIDGAGQSEAAVVNAAGNSFAPVWTADGAHLVFASNKSGAPAVWSVGIRDGRSTGDPSLLISEPVIPLGANRAGALYFRATNMSNFNQLGFVAELEAGGARITKTFVGEGISWSPDGKSLAYIRNTNAPQAVMIRNVETGEERAYVQPNLGLQQARWLPDSSGVVVFVRDQPSTPDNGNMYALDVKSGEFKKLMAVRPGRSAVMAVSPDGKTFYTSQKGADTMELIAVDLASGSERKIATFPSRSDAFAGLSISPDGSSLAVQTWADQQQRLGRLLVARTDGSGTRELLPSFPADRTLSVLKWTADGRSILYFATAENGDWRLMRISPEGGQPESTGLESTRLTGTVRIPPSGPYSPLSMDASPDGTRIVFAFRPALRTELWSLDDVTSVIAARR